jgi:glutathione S-transferase
LLELYYSPGTCSFVIHAALEIIRASEGVDFVGHVVKVHKNEQCRPEFLAINPNAQVPVLVVDGKPLTQVLAIGDYLDRRFPAAGLLPGGAWERAQALSQLAFMNNTAHPTFAHVFMTHHFGEGDSVHAELKRFNRIRFRDHLERLEQWLGASGAPFWLGERPSLLDAYALTLLRWGGFAGIDPEALPQLWALAQRLAAVPAVAAVLARERLELNVYRKPADMANAGA